MGFGLAFSPLVPDWVIWTALAIAAVIALLLFVTRTRGAAIRTIALALLVAALANPSLTREDRDPLTSVAVVPLAAGITGDTYRDPAAFTSGFRTDMVITAAVVEAGGLLAAATIRNPRKPDEPAEPTKPVAPVTNAMSLIHAAPQRRRCHAERIASFRNLPAKQHGDGDKDLTRTLQQRDGDADFRR